MADEKTDEAHDEIFGRQHEKHIPTETKNEADDDEDEVQQAPEERVEAVDGVQPKRADEQLCPSCFLLVRSGMPACPVGDDDCPIFSS